MYSIKAPNGSRKNVKAALASSSHLSAVKAIKLLPTLSENFRQMGVFGIVHRSCSASRFCRSSSRKPLGPLLSLFFSYCTLFHPSTTPLAYQALAIFNIGRETWRGTVVVANTRVHTHTHLYRYVNNLLKFWKLLALFILTSLLKFFSPSPVFVCFSKKNFVFSSFWFFLTLVCKLFVQSIKIFFCYW